MSTALAQSASSFKTPTAGPLLIFVLGPPAAGKSTLCEAISAGYNLDHFSIGDEIRSLVSSQPTGHAARIKPKFTASELEIFTKSVRAGTLGPVNQTPMYVKERIFPEGTDPRDVKILIDGFPRHVDRWEAFKESSRGLWEPNTAIALSMAVDREIARERFVARGRAGDVFEKRFDDHDVTIGDIVKAMRRDGVSVYEHCGTKSVGADDMLSCLEMDEDWVDVVGERVDRGT